MYICPADGCAKADNCACQPCVHRKILFCSQTVVVDGKGHLLGRLAAVCAKQLLEGKAITVTRCEEMNVSGTLFRNRCTFPHIR